MNSRFRSDNLQTSFMDCKNSYCSYNIQGYSGIENWAMQTYYTMNLWSVKSNPTWNFLFYDLTLRFTTAMAYSKISGGCSNISFWNFECWSIRHRTKLQHYTKIKQKKNIWCWGQSRSAVSFSTGKLIKWATRVRMCFCKEGTIGNAFPYLFLITIPKSSSYSIRIFPSTKTKHRIIITKEKKKKR